MIFKKYRLLIILAFVLLAGGSVVTMQNIRFEFDFSAFLPPNDPELIFYNQFKHKFSGGGSTIGVGLHNEEGAFRKDFVDKVHKATLEIRKLPYVKDASSLPLLKDVIWDPITPLRQKVIDRKSQETLDADSVRIMNDPRFVNSLISETGKTMLVLVTLDSSRYLPGEALLADTLSSLLPDYGFDSFHLTGYPIGRTVLRRTQQKEFLWYTGIASLVLFLAMIVIFGRWRGIAVATLSVLLGMVLFLGLYGLSGRPFDLMGTLYPILLVIVGTSDVVHILTKYVDELRKGIPRGKALKVTIREIGVATLMTSLTTAVGFASLYVSRMPPIKYFGLFAAIGIFIAFLTVILLTTALISFTFADKLMRKPSERNRFNKVLDWFYWVTKERRNWVLGGLAVVLIISGVGIANIETNLHEIRDFPNPSALREDFSFMDKEFHGLNNITFAIEAADSHEITDFEVQREIQKLEDKVKEYPEFGKIWSPLILLKIANRFYHGNQAEHFRAADSPAEVKNQMEVVNKLFKGLFRSLVSEDNKVSKVAVNIQDIGSEQVGHLTDELVEWIDQSIDKHVLTFRVTGAKYLFDTNQEWLVNNLLKSLGLAFLIVSIFMAALFRDIRLVIISLIPNVIPLVITAALIGFMGFELDPKIAIVFTIAFGIAVDDTIHFLTRFKIERQKGATVEDSIRLTFKETGKAIVITSILLFSGFITLVGSAFPPTFVIGLLIALTLLIALLSDFLILPILLRWLIKD